MALVTYDGTFGSVRTVDLTGTNDMTLVWDLRDNNSGRTTSETFLSYGNFGAAGTRNFAWQGLSGNRWELAAYASGFGYVFHPFTPPAADGLIHRYALVLRMAGGAQTWKVWRDGAPLAIGGAQYSGATNLGGGGFVPTPSSVYVARNAGGGAFAKITADEPVFYPYAMTDAAAAAASTAGASATLTATLAPLSADLSGSSSLPPAISGTLDAILPALSADLSGASSAAVISGDLDATLPALSADLGGTVETYTTSTALGATLPALTAAFVADMPDVKQAVTVTVNRANGRTRMCEWSVEVEPPVTTPTRDRGHDYANATSIFGNTLDDGRPT